jgi:hypothetical protein
MHHSELGSEVSAVAKGLHIGSILKLVVLQVNRVKG